MTSLRKLGKQASQYLAGRVLLMALGLVSFPLIARLLSVRQYGELSLVLKLALLWTVLSKAGLQNAVLRFLPEAAKEGGERERATVSTLILLASIIAGSMALLAGAVLALHTFHLPGAALTLAPLALGLVFVRAVQPALSGVLRIEGRAVLFNVCELLGRALAVLLSLAALTWIAVDLHFYLAGLLVAEASVILALLAWFVHRGLLGARCLDWTLCRRALVFSAPLITYELASVLLDSGDRLFIGHYLGLRQVGFYSAAYAIATYTEEALMVPVNLALLPTYMSLWVEQGEAAVARFLSRALDLFFAGACGVLLVSALTAHDLIALLASRKFAEAQPLLPVLVAGLLVYALHIFFNAPLMIHRKSMILSAVTIGCCALNAGLNILLLPHMGVMGAAVATLVSYLAFVLALAVCSRRFLPFPLPVGGALASLAAAGLSYWTFQGVTAPHLWLSFLLRGGGSLLAYAALVALAHPAIRPLVLRAAGRKPRLAASADRSLLDVSR